MINRSWYLKIEGLLGWEYFREIMQTSINFYKQIHVECDVSHLDPLITKKIVFLMLSVNEN